MTLQINQKPRLAGRSGEYFEEGSSRPIYMQISYIALEAQLNAKSCRSTINISIS